MAQLKSIYHRIDLEINQHHPTRKGLIARLEKVVERPVLCYATSFVHPVAMDDNDAVVIEDILQRMDLSKGLALLISSDGGDGLAAERIINACQAHSATGEFIVIVPNMAKSAATMVCMGASEIWMSPTSELGPIDPQIMRFENGVWRVWAAHSLVKQYDSLMQSIHSSGANNRLEGLIQQLHYFDPRDVQRWKDTIDLSKGIAIKALKGCMLSSLSEADIENHIDVFLKPDSGTTDHGRPIYSKEAKSCHLNIREISVHSSEWKLIYELYVRLNTYVSRSVSKSVENKSEYFSVAVPVQ